MIKYYCAVCLEGRLLNPRLFIFYQSRSYKSTLVKIIKYEQQKGVINRSALKHFKDTGCNLISDPREGYIVGLRY